MLGLNVCKEAKATPIAKQLKIGKDLYVIVEPEGQLQKDLYTDLYHGQCRQAFIPADHASMTPEFHISGPVSVWKAIAEKKLDPIKALFTRQITLKGNMAKVLKNVKAAQELVNCTTGFETNFSNQVLRLAVSPTKVLNSLPVGHVGGCRRGRPSQISRSDTRPPPRKKEITA
jgi:putative sterol carrier protein